MGAVIFLFSFLVTRGSIPLFLTMIINSSFIKENWQGKKIPAIAGIIFPFVLSISLFLFLGFGEHKNLLPISVSLLAIFCTAFAGLIDDVLGSAYPRGLLNHFRYFFQRRKISSGLVKAVLIGFIALWVATVYSRNSPELFLHWLLLVLTVNSINLLDLRPGRALKGVIFLFVFPFILQIPDLRLLYSSLGIMVAYAPYDLKGKAMMGDTGANVLGMITGLILLGAPLWVKAFFLFLFLLLHILTEQYSLSSLIEKSAILRRIDDWGREEVLKAGVKR